MGFDLDDYKLANEIVAAAAEVSRVEQVTRDMYRLVLDGPEARGLAFTPGQYLDVRVPGTELKRSFSIAGLPGEPIELFVRHYPGGRSNHLDAEGAITRGQVIEFTGPYGSLRLRESGRPAVMIAGGSGIAPVFGLLRHLAQAGPGNRPVRAFYGVRQVQDLFDAERLGFLASGIPDCRFCPVLSECDDPGWTGERGLVHEVAGRSSPPRDINARPVPVRTAAHGRGGDRALLRPLRRARPADLLRQVHDRRPRPLAADRGSRARRAVRYGYALHVL